MTSNRALVCSIAWLGLAACSQKTPQTATPERPNASPMGNGDALEVKSVSPLASATVERAPFHRVDIMDPQGFNAPMVAATAQIPSDWETRGGIGWDRSSDCVSNHLRVKWYAGSRDGRTAFEMLPGMTWQVQGTEVQMNPCPALPARKARDLLHLVAQRFANVRELDYRNRPDLAPAPQNTQPGVNASTDGGQLLIAFREGNDEMRAILSTTVNITEVQGNIVVGAPAVYALRAPDGQLDFALGDQIMKSIKLTPDWTQVMQKSSMDAVQRVSDRQRNDINTWHNGQMARINAQGARDRSQIALQTSREVAQIYSNTWSNGQKTDDAIQRRTLEAIGGYNTYADPNAGANVQGSIDYDRVLRTESGTYVGTDDPDFNPAGSQELQRIP